MGYSYAQKRLRGFSRTWLVSMLLVLALGIFQSLQQFDAQDNPVGMSSLVVMSEESIIADSEHRDFVLPAPFSDISESTPPPLIRILREFFISLEAPPPRPV